MKKILYVFLVCVMCLGMCACGAANSEEWYNKAKSYAENDDYMLAVEMMEKAGNYKDSKILLNEYKYAYAMDLIGFMNQFEAPEIQESYDLHTIASLIDAEEEYFDDYKKAYNLLKELRNDGYGKNVEYLMELIMIDMGNT